VNHLLDADVTLPDHILQLDGPHARLLELLKRFAGVDRLMLP
jgi:hypothetical protein